MITVVGAGLAGSEAAWYLAERGQQVRLIEMRPKVNTPAHHTAYFAELVCSNSLKAERPETASGMLKEEMRMLGSLVLTVAENHRVEAGGALAVDRLGFSMEITERLKNHPNITLVEEEVTDAESLSGLTIIATGPLTSGPLFDSLRKMHGEDNLYFYDAAAPIVTKESIDFDKAYMASRYDRGEAAYINCPMNKDEYAAFYDALVAAEVATLHEFETEKVFEGCMPVEKMARRGFKTLCFGPLKPRGLKDPRTGREPYAVLQLRQDNAEGTLYNLVGFQTNLKFGEQKRVFSMIPGLENAEFVRYGVMHRNTYLNSTRVLQPTLESRMKEGLFFAGQITGMEGYMESAAGGLMAAYNVLRKVQGKEPLAFPPESILGALSRYVSDPNKKDLQPMNANFGILPSLVARPRSKEERGRAYYDRGIEIFRRFMEEGEN